MVSVLCTLMSISSALGKGTIQFLQARQSPASIGEELALQDSDIPLVLMYKLILFLMQAPFFHLSPTPKDDSIQKASCAAFSAESGSARRETGHCFLTLSALESSRTSSACLDK